MGSPRKMDSRSTANRSVIRPERFEFQAVVFNRRRQLKSISDWTGYFLVAKCWIADYNLQLGER
jgi:hypothetical protein